MPDQPAASLEAPTPPQLPTPVPARLLWEEPPSPKAPRRSRGSRDQGGPRDSAGPGGAGSSGRPGGKRPRGRWIWTTSGVVVVTAVTVPLAALILNAGNNGGGDAVTAAPTTHVVTIAAAVTSVSVQSYGSDVRVGGGSGKHVQVTEIIQYDPGAGDVPVVTDAVSDGRLTLAAPACATSDCSVGFVIAVPSGVAVTAQTQGGNIMVSGVAGANLDSGSGQVVASGVSGPLTVSSMGGSQELVNVRGPLKSDSGSGEVVAQGITGPTAVITTDGGPLSMRSVTTPSVTVSTGGGDGQLAFTTAPSSVDLTTDGGAAILQVPGGPYALTADSSGGPEAVGIATDPAARRSLTVTSGGGQLVVEPSSSRGGPSVTVSPGDGVLSPIPPIPPVAPFPRKP